MNNLRRVAKAEKALLKNAIKKTNADRIRAMTNEELAVHMVSSVENALLRFANVRLQGDALSEYIAYWICWLKQET